MHFDQTWLIQNWSKLRWKIESVIFPLNYIYSHFLFIKVTQEYKCGHNAIYYKYFTLLLFCFKLRLQLVLRGVKKCLLPSCDVIKCYSWFELVFRFRWGLALPIRTKEVEAQHWIWLYMCCSSMTFGPKHFFPNASRDKQNAVLETVFDTAYLRIK